MLHEGALLKSGPEQGGGWEFSETKNEENKKMKRKQKLKERRKKGETIGIK